MLSELSEQIIAAYEHLYDLVYLRSHPFAELLVPDPGLSRRERAWRLHRILLELVDELQPGPQAPVMSREWRRHRLMVLRYVDGLDPQAVADQIALGRRQYYREQEAAIAALARILWDRYLERPPQEAPEAPDVGQDASLSRPELLRLEAARAVQAGQQPRVGDVIAGVLSLLQDPLSQRQLAVHLALPDGLPHVSTERSLLRPLLLGILGYLLECASGATVNVAATAEPGAVRLSLAVEPADAVHPLPAAEAQERFSTFEELAAAAGARLSPLGPAQAVAGFEVQLPARPHRTLLVVDDNQDIVELFRRYLSLHPYQVVGAGGTHEALDLACQLQPQAITLDLMMPDQDGWDLLQVLLKHPETRSIPIIVCSVLRQKDLVLSLGATAFLEKPVSAQALLGALEALDRQ